MWTAKYQGPRFGMVNGHPESSVWSYGHSWGALVHDWWFWVVNDHVLRHP